MATTVTFGFAQILKATPTIIGRIRRGLNFFSGGVVTFLPAIASMIGTTTDKLALYMGLFMLAFNSISFMFGVDVSGDSVPTENVTEIKTGNTE